MGAFGVQGGGQLRPCPGEFGTLLSCLRLPPLGLLLDRCGRDIGEPTPILTPPRPGTMRRYGKRSKPTIRPRGQRAGHGRRIWPLTRSCLSFKAPDPSETRRMGSETSWPARSPSYPRSSVTAQTQANTVQVEAERRLRSSSSGWATGQVELISDELIELIKTREQVEHRQSQAAEQRAKLAALEPEKAHSTQRLADQQTTAPTRQPPSHTKDR